jgi:hypothetical protein
MPIPADKKRTQPQEKFCVVIEHGKQCGRSTRRSARSMCSKHYYRFCKYGDPLVYRVRRGPRIPNVLSQEEVDRLRKMLNITMFN